MDNLIFKISDYVGDGYNPFVDNLIAASDNIGSFPCDMNSLLLEPICCYDKYKFPLRINSLQVNKIMSEQDCFDIATNKLLDIEQNNLQDSYFSHVFPVNIKSATAKDFSSKCYYVDNTDCRWIEFFVTISVQKNEYLLPLNYTTSISQIDSIINRLRNDKIILKSENYIKEIVEFYMDSSCRNNVEFYVNFFYNKPICIMSLCNNNHIDDVVKSYPKLIIEANNHKRFGKRSSKDWIVNIEFNKLIQDDYISSMNYYTHICEQLDIEPNYSYFEYFHTIVADKDFTAFKQTDNTVLQDIMRYHYENY